MMGPCGAETTCPTVGCRRLIGVISAQISLGAAVVTGKGFEATMLELVVWAAETWPRVARVLMGCARRCGRCNEPEG